MPKIDPVTGCAVMTMSEFWRSEAQAEGLGRDGADVADEFYADLDKENEHEAERMRDPVEALRVLKAYDDQEEPAHRLGGGIVSLRRVLCAGSGLRVNASEGSIVAEVECADGSARFVRWSFSSWGGSRLDPPEYDESLDEITEAEASNEH
jgi:hypothetical protein